MVREFTKIGRYHKDNNTENQDVILWEENKRFSVITLADGVSSCNEARKGAETAGKAITDLFLRKGDFFLEFDKDKAPDLILSHILYKLRQKAAEEGNPLDEYSSTVASVLFDKKERNLLFFNLGDGLIAATEQNRFEVLAKPSNSSEGCYVTTTENAVRVVDINIVDAMSFDMVFIASDGAWKQMFEKNRLKNNVDRMLVEGDYEILNRYLEIANGYDDCSYIAMDLTLI